MYPGGVQALEALRRQGRGWLAGVAGMTGTVWLPAVADWLVVVGLWFVGGSSVLRFRVHEHLLLYIFLRILFHIVAVSVSAVTPLTRQLRLTNSTLNVNHSTLIHINRPSPSPTLAAIHGHACHAMLSP